VPFLLRSSTDGTIPYRGGFALNPASDRGRSPSRRFDLPLFRAPRRSRECVWSGSPIWGNVSTRIRHSSTGARQHLVTQRAHPLASLGFGLYTARSSVCARLSTSYVSGPAPPISLAAPCELVSGTNRRRRPRARRDVLLGHQVIPSRIGVTTMNIVGGGSSRPILLGQRLIQIMNRARSAQ